MRQWPTGVVVLSAYPSARRTLQVGASNVDLA
jgi:hypothetical protein